MSSVVLRPVAEVPPLRTWLALDGTRTPDEVGIFVAALADYVHVDPRWAEPNLVMAGGLMVSDIETGVSVVPGCCAGIEGWREWATLLDGETPWLGHDPTPTVEVVGDVFRLHQDGETSEPHVDIPRAALPSLLAGVQRDLAAFLTLVADWAERNGPPGNLVEVLDQSFRISYEH